MGQGRHFSPYQKGIVKRYYEHRDTILNQRLGELISELYMTMDEKKRVRQWERVRKALEGSKVDPSRYKKILDERNIRGLAALANELF